MTIPQQNLWSEVSLKFLFLNRTIGVWGEDAQDGEGIICIRAADFITHELRHSKKDLTRRQYELRDILTRQLQKGDLIIEKSGGGDNQPVGRVVSFELDETAVCSNFLERLRPNQDILHPRFGAYLLYSLWASRAVIPFIKQTTGIQNLDASEYFAQVVTTPPLSEQRAIADHLDRETAKLDTLIAAKQRLLDLLVEKRRALITQAVTRGLNPAAPLRDSGVEWLGKIPAHWDTPPVYTRYDVQLGKMLDEKRIRGTHLAPYLRNVDVQWGYVNTKNLQEMDFDEEDREKYALHSGDILVCEGGELGRTAIWHGELRDCYFQKAILRLRPATQKDISEFFVYVMYMMVKMGIFSLQATNATIQHLPAETLRRMRYAAPPYSEQRAIVRYLDQQIGKLEALMAATSSTIEFLYERRAALIAAAVTGKLPVTASCN
jgi:type I restriction enzyme, S subunit